MSYAEHGPRIFLAGRPSNGVPLTYGDYVLPKKRSEGRLKLYNSCTDIRAWSPNILESTRYFRELNEHDPAPGRVIPFNVVMENMIGLTAQAQNELRVARRELQKYKSLKLTSEQQKYLENFVTTVVINETEEMKVEAIIRPLSQKGSFNANKIAALQHSDMYLSMYFHPGRRFRYDRGVHNYLLTNTHVLRENLNAKPLSENNTYLVSRVTSCDILTEARSVRDYSDQTSTYIEYVDASSQVMQEVCEVGVQTDGYKNDAYDGQSNVDSSSSQYCESSESVSTSESELRINLDPLVVCEKNHKGVIIQKDSEIIVLKNELGMKEDELEELRELNKHLQTLLKEEDENANILRHNFNILQEKLKIVNDKRNVEVENLSAKLSSSECLVDQLKMELGRKCQVCYLQSQEIQKLRQEVKETEVLSIENESLTRKMKEMEHLSKEAESCGIALEQVKNVWWERDMLQKQYHEQSCTLADREDEIKRLLTLIKQMSVAADTREVEMNDVVANLKNEIQVKNEKISQCEMQLICMEREVGNLTNMLKSSLNNLDESKIAYEGICEYTKCEHDTCLDVQSALSALKAFIAELEECKLERRNRLREIDNLKAYVACYSQESVSEITNTDFDTGHGSIQPVAEDSTSSNCGDCHLSKELVNVQIQSDDIDSSAICSEESEKIELNEIISYEEIDHALATHIKRSIDKIHEISTVLQGAGDYHVQIVKEFAKQQQELQKKDLEITKLKQKVAEHMLQRGEGDCMIQEQIRKRMLEKEKVLEAVINKRDSEIERLHEDLLSLKSENVDLFDTNTAQNEELRVQRDQMRKLNQQIDDLQQTINILKQETNNVDNMRKKLMELQMENNDLKNKLTQANEIISKNAEIIADLERKDEKNRMTLTHESIRYDAMITQKQDDIVKLQKENQSLCDQLSKVVIELARSNDTISLLRRESDNMAVINVLQANLSDLDVDKERLLVKVDYLRSEIVSCQSSTADIENELRTISQRNETLKTDIDAVKNTNDQLLYTHEDMVKSLKDTLYTLPGKIYEKIVRLRTEIKEDDTEMENTSEQHQSKEILENEKGKQQAKSCQQDEEFYASQCTHDELVTVAQEVDCNIENAVHKLRFLEGQYESKLHEIKNLMDDVKLRDYEIKNLEECITYLLQEKNDLQTKVKSQVEEYQNKLALLKKKYDSSLNAFRKRHNENVERLQTRFEDIMKMEKSPFDSESWLQSLNLKELTELHNRINILSSHAVENTESNITHTETKDHYRPRNNSEDHKFYNKFTLHKQYTTENRLSLNKKASKNELIFENLNMENNEEKISITELYSRDFKQKHRFFDDGKEQTENTESSKPRIDRTLDWQREKFIYQCSIHHKLNNAR
ncbi:putative leucine-rich repeat-containing protein DDB_G0290503 [Polyergus mexicanus]|uniref:putative leucine-rich repeat-containing protein DDB_G0290503 n=1 Tax=Polyergus mexicanus TaxID=615972 RepID=UPI0038B4F741